MSKKKAKKNSKRRNPKRRLLRFAVVFSFCLVFVLGLAMERCPNDSAAIIGPPRNIAAKLKVYHGNTFNSSSGILVRYKERLFLVTNTHNLNKPESRGVEIVMRDHADQPYSLFETLRQSDGTPLWKVHQKELQIPFSRDGSGPTYTVDVAVLKIQSADLSRLSYWDLDKILEQNITARTDCGCLGYPFGRNVAEWRMGETIELADLRVSTTVQTERGMSGGPLFEIGTQSRFLGRRCRPVIESWLGLLGNHHAGRDGKLVTSGPGYRAIVEVLDLFPPN